MKQYELDNYDFGDMLYEYQGIWIDYFLDDSMIYTRELKPAVEELT